MADLLSIAQVQSRLINGVTQVNVELVSGASKTQKLQYQFTWFDEQGFVVEPNKTPWTPLSLHGGQIKNYVLSRLMQRQQLLVSMCVEHIAKPMNLKRNNT